MVNNYSTKTAILSSVVMKGILTNLTVHQGILRISTEKKYSNIKTRNTNENVKNVEFNSDYRNSRDLAR